jgi:hypothetical protein
MSEVSCIICYLCALQHLVLVYCNQLILIQGFHNNNITSVCLYVGKITYQRAQVPNECVGMLSGDALSNKLSQFHISCIFSPWESFLC